MHKGSTTDHLRIGFHNADAVDIVYFQVEVKNRNVGTLARAVRDGNRGTIRMRTALPFRLWR